MVSVLSVIRLPLFGTHFHLKSASLACFNETNLKTHPLFQLTHNIYMTLVFFGGPWAVSSYSATWVSGRGDRCWGLRKDMAVMNFQNDGKQVLQFCNQCVQEWVASVSAAAGVKQGLFWNYTLVFNFECMNDMERPRVVYNMAFLFHVVQIVTLIFTLGIFI